MLSNITNYLFGGYQNNDEADKDVHFQEVEEDDWTVVDTLGMLKFLYNMNIVKV